LQFVISQPCDPVTGDQALGPEGSTQASGSLVNLSESKPILATNYGGCIGLFER
jgi:hypothetical protein